MMPSLRVAVAIGAALVGIAATVSLGNWQLRRAAEKIAIEQSGTLPSTCRPGNCTAIPIWRLSRPTFRSAWCAGQIRTRPHYLARYRALEGRAGFSVVTPLRVQGSQRGSW